MIYLRLSLPYTHTPHKSQVKSVRVCVCLSHVVGSEVVQQSAEGQPVPPGGGEVGDLHPAVVLGDLATPGEQRLAGVGLPAKHRAGDGAGLDTERETERGGKVQVFYREGTFYPV